MTKILKINQNLLLAKSFFCRVKKTSSLKNFYSTLINKSEIDYYKDKKHTTWTIGFQVLEDIELAKSQLPNNIVKGRKYIFIVKVVLLHSDLEKSAGKLGHVYLMCGTQSIFSYDDETSINDFLLEVEAKVRITIEDYKMEDFQFQCIQVMLWNIGLSIKKENSNIKNSRSIALNKMLRDDLRLPIHTDENILGSPLKVDYDSSGYISNIESSIDGVKSNFIELVLNKIRLTNNKKWNRFNQNWKFYDISFNNNAYVLGIHTFDKCTVYKALFTNTGSLLYTVTDFYNSKGEFTTRVSGNKTIVGDNHCIYDVTRDLNLKAIPRIRSKKYIHQYIPNTNIGSLDCETFIDVDNINKVYAIGFKDNINKKSNLYHINDYDGSSNKMVIQFIDDIMAPKYNNITFYCHNWGGYDSIFIIKILSEYNQNVDNKYKMNYHFRDNKIYKLVIYNTLDRNRRVTICDSYTILNSSLKELCLSYDIDENKLYFPYKFVSRDTMNYIGNTPSRDYYNNIPIQEYYKLLSPDWNMEIESLNYMNNDIEILIKILNKVNKQLFDDYNVSISDKSTIAGLATKIFMKDHYKGNIPSINKSTIYNDIVKGYYGGVTEVYIPYGENLYYYDVNSLYPSVCLNPMPGVNNAKKVEYIDKQPDIKDIFGFYYCDVETPKDLYIGVLPVRNDKGLIFPLGRFSGWYFSEELKFAVSLGYKVKIYKGYSFEKEYDTFKSYVDTIYSIKNNPSNKTQKSIAKGLLNNLLGRFGISLNKPITKIVDGTTFNNLLLKNRIVDHKHISINSILVTYYDVLDPFLVNESDLSIEELLNNRTNEYGQHSTTSIVISAAVTAYARIEMSKIKLDILSDKGKIYYSDTDSIVTDVKLPDQIVSPNELGKLKLEHKIKKGIFISGKTYCFINDEDQFVNKAKGVSSNSLGWEEYIDMLNDIPITGLKTTSKVNWDVGDVNISTDNVILNSDVYKKRTKIYQNGVWSNTKPLVIDVNGIESNTYVGNAVHGIKNILKTIPITSKRFYSSISLLKDKVIHKSKNSINTIPGLYNLLKPKINKVKSFIYDIMMVCLVLILYVIYWVFKLDDDTLHELTDHDIENIDSDIPIILVNTELDTIDSKPVKGHYLLDDSLYDSNEYTIPNNIVEDENEKDSNLQSTDYNYPINICDDLTDYTPNNENNIVINYEGNLYNNEIFVDKIRQLEQASSFKSIIIEPYNSEEFNPHKTYINYELGENSYVPERMLIEISNDQPIVPIDTSFKFTYEPKSIVRNTFSEEEIEISLDKVDVRSESLDSDYCSLESVSSESDYLSAVSEPDKIDDRDTIVSIIDHYTGKKTQT